MEIILTESQLSLLLEQESNIYTDEKEYKQALRKYNKIMYQYLGFLDLYNVKDDWGVGFGMNQSIFSSKNLQNLGKTLLNSLPNDIPIFMDMYYRCLNNLDRWRYPGYKLAPEHCNEGKTIFKLIKDLKIEKWYQVKNGLWVPLFVKPNIKKPIFKPVSPEPTPSTPEIKKPPISKTLPVVNYKEVKSKVTTFGTPYKTGTPLIELNIPGGPYYLTYPEFEEYKKTRPNTKFNKK